MIKHNSIQFSAVIPTYNREKLIERTVESALQQSCPPVEIIVVDDGSSDSTKQRLSHFGEPVRYIYQENSGPAVARNRGVSEAKSDWIAFLDSDDIWEKDHLWRMAQAITGTLGQANYYFADTLESEELGGGLLWSKIDYFIDEAYELIPDGTELAMMKDRSRQPMMLQSSVFNKSILLNYGGLNTELRVRDDSHIFMKLGLGQPICAVAGCGAFMTADDTPENRLTMNSDLADDWIEDFVIMYGDLLQTRDDLPKETRIELQQRLATILRTLARRSWKKRQFAEAANYLIRAFATDPLQQIQAVMARI
jgi:glycosyltransferase involved in cell wall biosynthesis